MRRAISLVLTCLLLVVVAWSTPALAEESDDRSHSYDSVAIEALVTPNGDLHVLERRVVTYEGAWHGIYWDISHRQSVLSDGVEVLDAGEFVEGKRVPYELVEPPHGDAEAEPGTYEVSKHNYSVMRADLHFDKRDETAEFYVEYLMTRAAVRWSDTSDLGWYFIDDGWDGDAYNVTCDVWIQRPDDSGVWPGENVLAWAGNSFRYCEVTDVSDDYVPTSLAGEGADSARAAHLRVEFDRVENDVSATLTILFPRDWLVEGNEINKPYRDEEMARMQEEVDNTVRFEKERESSGAAGATFFMSIFGVSALFVIVGRFIGGGRYRDHDSGGSRSGGSSGGSRSGGGGSSGGGGGSY